ncbi:hypothetical protein FHR99_000214 [Litorivivens lipolytica]|uniref:Porin n=1 Tax=Litorivivens lipolytica TaxID=1524264 RepID=A0A7W4Z4D0_9GAMM|nr:hypothetical protein [Litorivivens lipolytica]MBB3045978.1 hypothetical protein [Litorivivens lipolytica]
MTATTQANQDSLSLHGFFSQGYLYSKGNDFFGESTDGSWEYYEAGAGGRYRVAPYLSLAGQFFARDAGRGDNGSVRTDYLYADLRLAQSNNAGTSIRVGRVRNPFGFYNSTRDVFFTRPSILLPQQYLESFGVRELLFSSDGAQFHSYWEGDNHHLEFTSTFGKNDKISSDTVTNMFGAGSSLNGDAELQSPVFAQLSGGLAGDRWKAALSYYNTTLAFSNTSIVASLDATLMAASLQYNAEKLSLTGEYSLLSSNSVFVIPAVNLVSTGNSKTETAYIQADYRLDNKVTAYTRFDHRLGNRERPNETDSSILTLGARWEPRKQWRFAAEIHGIRGTAPIPAIDNRNTSLAERSELIVLMAGYRF